MNLLEKLLGPRPACSCGKRMVRLKRSIPIFVCPCGAMKIGRNTVTLDGAGNLVRWSASGTPAVLGEVGMNTATGRLQQFVGGAAQNVANLSDATSAGDIILEKPFFSANGILPANVIREDLYTMPAWDFANFGAVTKEFSMSRLRTGGEQNWNFGWDLGAEYGKVLFIVNSFKTTACSLRLFLTDTLPTLSSDVPDNLYTLIGDGSSQAMYLYKRVAGTYTELVSDGFFSIFNNSGVYAGPMYGMAIYYDATTDRLVGLVKAEGGWLPILEVTDAEFSQFRYVGINFLPLAGQRAWVSVPMGIYAE